MDCIKNSDNINLLWSNIIVEELIRHKIDYFCISPGSRSTPLTVAAARHSKSRCKLFYDERGSAFHAIGYARATKKPAVLICTSGTAVANYYPAVIEASQEALPLIVLSADRPPELRNRGANQTIDQANIFGKYSRYFTEMPCPSIENPAGFVLQEINQAIKKCMADNGGPVQVNCMFREPLAPQKEQWPASYINDISEWLKDNKPFFEIEKDIVQANETSFDEIVTMLNDNKKGIILLGRCEDAQSRKAVVDLAEHCGWPVFPDITSGLRLNSNSDKVIHYFDQLLLSENLRDRLSNLPVLHFGGQLVSKRLLKFLEKHKAGHIHVMPTNKKIDPANSVTSRIPFAIDRVINHVMPRIKTKSLFYKDLQILSQGVHSDVLNFLKSQNKINEISAVVSISKDIFNETALFVASSMPVRDMDMFAVPGEAHIMVGSNRGASGIDGTIASAIGFANGLQRPLVLLIGDLAFLHDLNSLAMIKECEQPVLIILINNQGGGIFSFLPIAQYEDVFEKNFATPHSYSFDKIAEIFSMKYFNPKTSDDFSSLFSQYQYSKKPTLIEIKTNREENYRLHKNLQEQILSKLP